MIRRIGRNAMLENDKKLPFVKAQDDQLLEALRNGSEQAFQNVYSAFWQKLYLSAFKIVRNREAAEDIVQEIFVQLWRRKHELHIECLASYLFTATRYQVFKYLRKSRVLTALDEVLHDELSVDDLEGKIHEKELSQRIDEAILKLPPKCQGIFQMSRKKQLSTKEIASKLNLSPKTVENQLGIALKKLRLILGEMLLLALFLTR